MKGIILAGGRGTRLWPITFSTSKQLLPIFDKPMVYYPLSTLMQAGIRDILLISSPEDLEDYRHLLGDGDRFGISIKYELQERPEGLPQAFIIGDEFIGDSSVALILGDNLFHGEGMSELLHKSIKDTEKNGFANLFGFRVDDPQRFGVAEVTSGGVITSIVEKPAKPTSDIAVTGLYMYGSEVVQKAKNLHPSKRGELEISDLNMGYVDSGEAKITIFGKGFRWLDTGTVNSLISASNFIMKTQESTLVPIGCPEVIAYRMGFIDENKLIESCEIYPRGNEYGDFIRSSIFG
ncbi:MAG: glucose-1-phosphate thymidylyltransferase [Euryarchaeota archaeon]|nr:glucose-1-phosphate thymidylyltransferase [Euryarchaeota archaeon]